MVFVYFNFFELYTYFCIYKFIHFLPKKVAINCKATWYKVSSTYETILVRGLAWMHIKALMERQNEVYDKKDRIGMKLNLNIKPFQYLVDERMDHRSILVGSWRRQT